MPDCYYTITPPQFATDGAEPPASQLVCYKGVNLYVRPYDNTRYQVTGLCTTNPGHYLRKDLMPGALIPMLGSQK